jgi:hypothetical protein
LSFISVPFLLFGVVGVVLQASSKSNASVGWMAVKVSVPCCSVLAPSPVASSMPLRDSAPSAMCSHAPRPCLSSCVTVSSGLEPDAIDVRVLMNRRRTVATVRRDDEHLQRVGLFRGWTPLGVARSEPAFARLNPDLQKVQRLPGDGLNSLCVTPLPALMS